MEIEKTQRATEQTAESLRVPSTVERHIEELLGGPATYTVAEAAEASGLTVDEVVSFWRDLGFPTISKDSQSPLFTAGDVEAMKGHGELLANTDLASGMSRDTIRTLIRGQSQAMDRLVLWQQDALLKYAEETLGLDSISARFWLLDHIGDYENFLFEEMLYVWKRHIAAHMRQMEMEWTSMPAASAQDARVNLAVGFIDLVSFTLRSNELAHH